jgi:hypothetical protein
LGFCVDRFSYRDGEDVVFAIAVTARSLSICGWRVNSSTLLALPDNPAAISFYGSNVAWGRFPDSNRFAVEVATGLVIIEYNDTNFVVISHNPLDFSGLFPLFFFHFSFLSFIHFFFFFSN